MPTRLRTAAMPAAPADGISAPRKLPWPVSLFLIGLVIPWIVPLGPLHLPVYRMILVITLLPCLKMWASGRAGPIRAADIALILYSLWAGLCLARTEAVGGAVQSTGVVIVETVGGYLLARCYVRDAETFRRVILFMTKLIFLLMPFLLYEWLTGNKLLLKAFGAVFPTVDATLMTPRMGLWRVQGPFEHSIAYGAFCGSMFALVAMAATQTMPLFKRLFYTGGIGFAALLSMSSAPIAGVFVQALLIAWDTLLRNYKIRWKILWGLAFAAYLVVAFGSNQTPVQFYISKFTFDHQTGWYRIWIWEYGSASVLNHPLFGIGLNDWARPRWMPADSVDNFWLLTAMRYGLPAFLLLAGAVLWTSFAIARRKDLDEKFAAIRTAFLISMCAFIIVGTTVHFWDAPYAWFMFLLGSGVWLLEARPAEKPAEIESVKRGRRSGRSEPGKASRPPRMRQLRQSRSHMPPRRRSLTPD